MGFRAKEASSVEGGLYQPSAQATQAELMGLGSMPLWQRLQLPFPSLAVPTGQLEQAALSALEYLPTAHALHLSVPPPENLPVLHAVHVAALFMVP